MVPFAAFYYHTYTQCVADARTLNGEYGALFLELQDRQMAIARQIQRARTAAGLREVVDPKRSFSAAYENFTIEELHRKYLIDSELIDESGVNKTVDSAFENLQIHSKFMPVL